MDQISELLLNTSTNSARSGTTAPILLSSSLTSDVDEEERYWKVKVLHTALGSVLFDPESPIVTNLTPECLIQLRALYHDANAQMDPEQMSLITPEVSKLLQDAVGKEVQDMCDRLVLTSKYLLQQSDLPKDLERLSQINSSSDPVSQVLDFVEQRAVEEAKLDEELAKAVAAKATEVQLLEEGVNEARQILEMAVALADFERQPARIEKKLTDLRIRTDVLLTKTELAKKEKLVLENPPELNSQIEELSDKLCYIKGKLEAENEALTDFFQKYDHTDPEIKNLILKLKSTEEAIRRQQWMLDRMKALKDSHPENEADDFGGETFF